MLMRRLVSGLDDEALLCAAATGDRRAFAEFYDRHLPGLVAFFRSRVDSAELAFDLAAETFACVLAGAAGFDARRGSALGWTYSVARNLLIDTYRRRAASDKTRRRLQMQPVELCNSDIDHIERLAQSGASDLVAALSKLPADEREAIVARVLLEQSYEEIAATGACSQSVVRQRVSRGLKKIRYRMEERS
jgi:RNA polymerase sigma factor (sigma-70 family)